jgi:hypothetical protein
MLTVSHSGRGVIDLATRERVARNTSPVFPENGKVEGIGPILGEPIRVTEIDYVTGVLGTQSPRGDFSLTYEEGTITIRS